MAAEAPVVITQPDTSSKPDRRRTGRRLLSGGGGLALLGVTAALAGCGSSAKHNTASNSNNASTDVSVSNGTAPARHHSGRLHVEIADNHLGTPLFSSPEGGAVPNGVPGRIKYGTRVLVECYAPNQSGMTSVNDFYLIMGGVHGQMKDIRHTYAPADTFANGGPMGNNPDTIDPAVPKC